MARYRRRRSRRRGRFGIRVLGRRFKPLTLVLIAVAAYVFISPVRSFVSRILGKG